MTNEHEHDHRHGHDHVHGQKHDDEHFGGPGVRSTRPTNSALASRCSLITKGAF
jgi:hypothetical protein